MQNDSLVVQTQNKFPVIENISLSEKGLVLLYGMKCLTIIICTCFGNKDIVENKLFELVKSISL